MYCINMYMHILRDISLLLNSISNNIVTYLTSMTTADEINQQLLHFYVVFGISDIVRIIH